MVRRNSNSARRITVHGSDGRPRRFVVVAQQAAALHTEERVAALLRAANGLLAASAESRRRDLQFPAPAMLTVWPGVRLVEDDPSATPLLAAHETHCARYGREPDEPISRFRAACAAPDGTLSADRSVRLQAYLRVVEDAGAAPGAAAGGGGGALVSENMLSQYMYKTAVDNARGLWALKKQFAQGAAVSAVMCHLLLLGGRSPGRVLVCKGSGALAHAELLTSYDRAFQLERGAEAVPFRLTRNMAAFIGPHGVDGVLIAAAVAAAQGLQVDHSPLAAQLALFLRDDVLTWAVRRSGARTVAALGGSLSPAALQKCVAGNVRAALDRLGQAGPAAGAPVAGNPQAGMRALVEAATDRGNLAMMEPTWQPWL